MRRGFVFTLDAILSMVLVLIFITSIASVLTSNSQVYSTYMRSQSKGVAEGTLMTLRTVPLNQLVPPEKVGEWIRDGTLDTDLVSPDMDPLDIVSTYWATEPIYPEKNLRHKAEIILGYILNTTLKGYNYELLINNYTSPYLRKVGSNYSKARDVSPATLVMSGYAYNQTPRGHMARAYLTKLGSKENLYVIRGSYIESAAPSKNEYVIIKYIIPAGSIPKDATINSVKWFIEGAWTNSVYKLFINGEPVTCKRYNNWKEIGTNDLIVDNTNGDTCNLVEKVQEAIQNGENVVFEVWNYNDHWGARGGEDAAQYVEISYTTSTLSTVRFLRKFHFEDISSYYGIKVIKYPLILGRLRSLNIQLMVENVPASERSNPHFVRLYFFNEDIGPIYPSSTSISGDTVTYYWDNYTISSALSSYGIDYNMLSSKIIPIEIVVGDIDYKYSSSERLHIVGDSSFINADYVPNVLMTQYSIDITEPITSYSSSKCDNPNYGSSWCRDITWSFQIPSGVIPLWVFIQTPWLYYTNYNPSQAITVDNDLIFLTHIYKHPPQPFLFVLARIGYGKDTFDYQNNLVENAIAEGENTISVSLGYGYWLQPSNAHGEYMYLLQAYAGYGNVFPKYIRNGCKGYNITYYWVGDNNPHHILAGDEPYCQVTAQDLLDGRDKYAVDDAIIRLFNNLGGDGTISKPILVKLPDTVNIDLASMGNIPGLFKPIQITLRVWREG